MSVDHLYFNWATDEEGHPWITHNCTVGLEVYRCPPPWQLVGDRIEPSICCAKCGRHVILLAVDRVEFSELQRSQAQPPSAP